MAKRRKKRESVRRFKPLRWLIGLSVAILLLIAFLPTIISMTPLKQSVINWATSDFKGTINVKSAGLAWWSPVTVSGLTAVDENGKTLFEIGKLTTQKSLFSLATSSSYGKFTVDAVELNLLMRPDGTNIEDALTNYINAPSTGAPLPKLEVHWTNVAANIEAAGYDRKWRLTESNGTAMVAGEDSPLKITANGLLASDQSAPRPIQIGAAFGGDAKGISFADGTAEISGDQVELSIATVVFDRLQTPVAIAGIMGGKAKIAWSDWGDRLAFSTDRANFQHLIVQSPYYLGADSIRLDSAAVSGSFKMLPEGWLAEKLNAETNIGKVTANGLLNIDQFTQALTNGKLPTNDINATGVIDLAKLAQMLPSTLRLHQDVAITNASVDFQLNNWSEGGDRRALLNIETPRLEATRGGRPLAWNNPVRVSALARESNGDVALEKLSCNSEFFNIDGSGTLEQAGFTVNGDLQKMTEQLSQLFDLGGLKFGGTVNGRLGWDRTQAQSLYDPFTVGATLNINRPMVQTSTTRWEQPELKMEFVADTQIDSGKNILISTGKASMLAGQDRIDARLISAIKNPSAETMFPLSLTMSGGLDTWLAQISPFVSVDGINATGKLNGSSDVYVSMQKVAIRDLKADIEQAAIDAFGLRIREQKLSLAGNLDFDNLTGGFLLDQASLVSSTIAASGSSIRYEPDAMGGMGGSVAFRTDLSRLEKWFPQLDSTDVHWFGEATGTADLKYDGQVIAGVISAVAKDLVAASAQTASQSGVVPAASQNGWQILWREPEAKLDSRMAITPDMKTLKLDSLTLGSKAVKLNATGNISNLLTTMDLDLKGNWTPDFNELNGLISAYSGNNVSVTGGQSQAFTINGPLLVSADQNQSQGNAWIPNSLRAETQVAWQQISLYGLNIGPASATARLANSAASVQTASIPVSGGSVQLSPTIHLRGAAPTIVLPEGTIANQIQLTRENCQAWLKYVAPFVADATAAQGKFSVSTKGVRLPIANVNAASGNVDVVIHGAEVGPGPLGQQMIGLANQVKAIIEGPNAGVIANSNGAWLVMPEQAIPVEVNAGRVIHRNVTFKAGEMTIQTSGSVGLDQTINMVAEIPILDSWIGDRPYLAGLRGQKLSVPMTGTLTKPKLDTSKLQSFATQMLTSAAQGQATNLIQKESQKLQEKLFNGILNPGATQNGSTPTGDQNTPNGNLLNGAINEGFNQLFGPKKK